MTPRQSEPPQPRNRAERRAVKHGTATSELDLVRQRELWPVAEAAYRLGIHRVTLYRKAQDGEIRLVKVGRRTYVSDAELRRFVAAVEAAS